MENEIDNIPPSTAVINELVENKKLTRREKFKNFLLVFFITEHLILLILLIIPISSFIKTYASSDFIDLNQKAYEFTPEESSVVTGKYIEKYQNYVVDFVRPENERPIINISIEEKDLNSLLADLELEHIQKIYLEPNDKNIITVWAKTKFMPYPVIIQGKFNYNYDSKEFNIDILNWAIGSLTFPPEILSFIEDSVNKDGWYGLNNLLFQNAMHINKVDTTKGQLNIELQIDDKIKFTENILRASH